MKHIAITFLVSFFAISAFAGVRDFPQGYEALSGCEKQDYLWNSRLAPTTYSRLPAVEGSWSSLFTSISSILFLNQTFDHTSDAMPGARQKIIHSQGSVAKVEITMDDNSPFSGAFAPGTSCGIVRLSLAGSERSLGFTPGMGVKILIDGAPSINFQVMNSLNGQDRNRNFFAYTFTNFLPQPRGLILNSLKTALAVTGRNLRHLPIDHAAKRDIHGQRARIVIAPKQIAFVPYQSHAISSNSRNDFRIDLASIPEDAPLYEIHGLNNSGDWVKIGQVTLRSRLVASEFGDKHLFFRHAD